MNEPIISVSGLRGIVGESLDPVLAIRFVTAFAAGLEPGPIVVTRDGRTSGPMLADAICSGLAAVGRNVLFADVAATPTTGVLVRTHRAAGGIQISASHNPPAYNGIKLFGQAGRVITAEEGEPVIEQFRNDAIRWITYDHLGSVAALKDTTAEHLRMVLETVDVEQIRSRNYKVVLDSNHGAGSVLGRKLLEALDVDFQILGEPADGLYDHSPEPTQENLKGVADRAKSFAADVVFCQDPDADRLAVIDEIGNYIGEEYTLAITLQHRLKAAQGPVVVNCATSQMNADIASEASCQFELTAVGEANVTSKMIELDAVYGGEGNGGPIDPRVGYVRDSFVAMAQILDAMASTNRSISEIVAALPRYEIHKTTADVESQRLSTLLDEIRDQFPDVDYNTQDGLRLSWDDAWLLVRASNTEPIIRVIAEAKSSQQAQQLCQQVLAVVN